ncbi:predicted protein [Histoplasma capsulatum H143]|uniref:Uncharacterized protein n=1 Tax=Ajellomyces capsulatus (strain H143) TaxID=544712 RepID=C6HA27_AJECH|nr:predicted protein [Histoplasma capsulatum H143]
MPPRPINGNIIRRREPNVILSKSTPLDVVTTPDTELRSKSCAASDPQFEHVESSPRVVFSLFALSNRLGEEARWHGRAQQNSIFKCIQDLHVSAREEHIGILKSYLRASNPCGTARRNSCKFGQWTSLSWDGLEHGYMVRQALRLDGDGSPHVDGGSVNMGTVPKSHGRPAGSTCHCLNYGGGVFWLHIDARPTYIDMSIHVYGQKGSKDMGARHGMAVRGSCQRSRAFYKPDRMVRQSIVCTIRQLANDANAGRLEWRRTGPQPPNDNWSALEASTDQTYGQCYRPDKLRHGLDAWTDVRQTAGSRKGKLTSRETSYI